jgi:hypothetical protein
MSKAQNVPQQRAGGVIIVLLRITALVLVIFGVIGLIMWGINVRATGSDDALSDHILLGVGGTIFAAVTIAGVAFAMDLVAFVRAMERAAVIPRDREGTHQSPIGR